MPTDVVDLLKKLQKSVPDEIALAPGGASAATLAKAAERLGPLPASWAAFLRHADGGRLFTLDLWPVERVIAEAGEGPVRVGTHTEDGEPIWFDPARRTDGEALFGQGDPLEPTGGGAPGFEHFVAERAYTALDDLEVPPKRALKALVEHATERGGRLGGGGITFAAPSDEAELPIPALRGTVVKHEVSDPALKAAAEAILGGPTEIVAIDSRIDHPLVHTKGRAEFAVWIETRGKVKGKAKAEGAMVRLARPVWKQGLEGKVLGDIAYIVVPGTKGPKQVHDDREPIAITVSGAGEAFSKLFAEHLKRSAK